MATPGTIAREYTAQLIGSFAPDCRIVRVGSGELVHLAEAFIRGHEPDRHQLTQILSPFFVGDECVDAIVLGCTHFPLLTDALARAAPRPVHWVDSGEAIARRVEHLLNEHLLKEQNVSTRQVGERSLPGNYRLALCTRPFDDAMQQGIRRFGFDRVELFEFE